MKLVEFYDKVDNSVGVAKILFNYLSKKYPSKKIKDIAKTTTGGTPNRSIPVYYGGNIPWIKSGELNDGLITSYEETITEDGLKNSSTKLYPKGTLVVALYGATVGKIGILDFDSTSNQAVCAIFPEDGISIEYLFWFFRQKRLEFLQQSFGGAQPNINQDVVKNTKAPIPPINIQESVQKLLFYIEKTKQVFDVKEYSTIIPRLQEFISTKEKYDLARRIFLENFELIQKLRQKILKEAVQGKLITRDLDDEPASELFKKIKIEKEKLIKEKKIKKEKSLPPISEEEIPYELPKEWTWCRLGDISQTISDGVHYAPAYLEKGVPCISAKDVYNHKINLKNCNYVSNEEYSSQKNKFNLRKNSLLVTKSGSIGRTAIFDGSYALYLVESIGVINVNEYLINPRYIQYLLDKIFDSITYSGDFVRGLGVKHLTLNLIGSIPVPLPPLKGQIRIVEKVDHLMKLCDELEEKVRENQKNSELLMDVFLRKAFQN